MSKLSESVKHMQEADAKKSIDFWFNNEDKRQEFNAELFKKLSNLEFASLKTSNYFYIEIFPFLQFDGTLVVKLPRVKSSHIEIGLFPNAHQEQYSLNNMYNVSLTVDDDTFNLDDLRYYCEKKSVAYTTCKLKTDQKESKSDAEYASQLLDTTLRSLNKILEAFTSET